jgi:uncharacterized membrane protein YcaP (DUF421 family)
MVSASIVCRFFRIMESFLHTVFGEGVEGHKLTLLQVVLRAILIFFMMLLVVRTANKRFFAKRTAFDIMLGFILGSMMARAINGSERLVPTIVGGFVLAFLHRGLGWIACYWPKAGGWIKGHGQTLVEDGQLNRETMRRHHIADDDLEEEFRLQGLVDRDKIQLARLERNGQVSVIRKQEK